MVKNMIIWLNVILCLIVVAGISSLAYWVWKSEKSRSE